MRLAFMGTPDFAVPSLRTLVDAGYEVAMVYCQPPRPAGRGQALKPSPVQRTAESLGLPVRSPVHFKARKDQEAFAALDVEGAVVAAYGLILPLPILKAPRLGCVNVHASLLPRWRGAAPIHRAIMAGDRQTGITIMQMEEGLDTGPMLAKAETVISLEDTTASLHDRLAEMGAQLLVETLVGLAHGHLTPQPQPDEGVTYAKKIDKAEARIDWTRPVGEIDAHVRGLCPFPGAYTDLYGTRLKVLAGKVMEGKGVPGTVLDDRLTIACADGAYRITRAQRPGKAPMEADALLRGFAVTPGMQMG